ncbi:hypothetical protein [Micrococcus sp. TA1]|uniref:hypothetical protein n=1 Tax=Micrococcus sp. TA1 TaxID=681627 RepID=UPI001613985A|nr:hypothetical protein [Micrococcus sp. TA1]MBB5748576.1 3-deoxy-D-arabino-heptulosonate 7-phosphate (DAHP) synthase [Micrococcus sp. TA1]
MDISKTTQPDSSQVNAEDLLAGPVTVTVTDVTAGNAEQPVNIGLAEYPGRAYRPSKSMRRILVAGWGPDASQYTGRRLTLVRNPDIRFGKDVVGGIEIAAMSHLEKPLAVALTVSRGKRRQFKVAPLQEAPPAQSTGEIPAEVIANVEKAKADGNLGSYLAWLEDQGAPEHITAYVKDQEEA